MIKIDADILKAAMLYKSKKDIRYYFEGLYIDHDTIVATNDHICFKAPIESDEQRIIKFQGKLPTSFKECVITGDIAEFTDDNLNVVVKLGVETIDARYPNYNRLYHDDIGEVSEIGFRGDYLQILGKTAKLLDDRQRCKFTFKNAIDGVKIKIGVAEIILMPVRL
ncbi:UNVERIFIED_ORG: hypothetical protein QIH99_gp35 [Proteus phage VB_PmiS-Isfahan]|uniref:DNA polymerase III beta subunit n=1 Tax=Proteus phage VB_PmiS-Isfahan TaxID=1969841 RepID=A0A1U9ZA93_9CAUD